MKQTGILFKPEMISAIIEGRKSMTRRIVKPQPSHKWGGGTNGNSIHARVNEKDVWIKCPYGVVGDVLYVKEGSRQVLHVFPSGSRREYEYKIDYKTIIKGHDKFKSPLFMPKAAARIWLEITDIRVERALDISEEDAIAEGITMNNKPHEGWYWMEDIYSTDSPQYAFQCLWNKINGEETWNSFVWVISFKRISNPNK